MFTGLIEEIGIVQSVHHNGESAVLSLNAHTVISDLRIGDSVSTNGACLTVTSFSTSGFTMEAVAETMQRTNLSELSIGDKVNLERALKMGDRLGGHLLSGHIDGTGTIKQISEEGNAYIVSIKTHPSILKYIIEKGSIAIDGISLTVMNLEESSFRVAIIPHTSHKTTLINKKAGTTVNIECDMIGKYIERFVILGEKEKSTSKIDMDFLRKHGF